MPTLGQKLREEREKRGLTINDLAAQTRISAHYFEAIEKDDAGSLPGGFFYRSFVKQYAELLGLPASAYQAELERSVEAESATTEAHGTALPRREFEVPPMPIGRKDTRVETQRWVMRVVVLVLVLVLCSGVFALWQHWRAQQEEFAKQMPPPMSAPAKQAAPQREAAKQEAPKLEEIKPEETKPGEPKPQEPGKEEVKKAVAAAPPAVAPQQAAAAQEKPASGTASGVVQVVVRATAPCWVGAWEGGRQVYGGMIAAGESRSFGASDRLRMRLGNAGGVDVLWNGQPLPALGPVGQVRTVEFRADGYAVIPPKPAAPPEPEPEKKEP